MQLLGCVCGCIGVVLVLLCIATCHWLEGDVRDYHQGLWQYCVNGGTGQVCQPATVKGKNYFVIHLFGHSYVDNRNMVNCLIISSISGIFINANFRFDGQCVTGIHEWLCNLECGVGLVDAQL